MVPAVYDQTTVDIDAKADRCRTFRATGSVPSSPAASRSTTRKEADARDEDDADEAKKDDDEGSSQLPPLAEGERLELKELAEQQFTQPPPRFTKRRS